MRLPELPAQNPAWYIGVVTSCRFALTKEI